MIQIRHITTKERSYYDYFEQIMTSSFPVEEYRELSELRRYTDKMDIFHCNLILEDDTPIGIFTYWDLGTFYYIEHFAIDPNLRSRGYGGRLMESISGLLTKPIVLEVEFPTDDFSERRIKFYQKHGFVLWERDYYQPPYRKEYARIPMLLMTYGELDTERDYAMVIKKIHKKVYNHIH